MRSDRAFAGKQFPCGKSPACAMWKVLNEDSNCSPVSHREPQRRHIPSAW